MCEKTTLLNQKKAFAFAQAILQGTAFKKPTLCHVSANISFMRILHNVKYVNRLSSLIFILF